MSRVTVFTVDELVEIVLALRGYNGSEHSPPGLTKHGRRALSDRIADDLGPVGSARQISTP
ncbi:MAG: hypothetical protein AAFQ17_01155 [Pseudomonadota bacterium]